LPPPSKGLSSFSLYRYLFISISRMLPLLPHFCTGEDLHFPPSIIDSEVMFHQFSSFFFRVFPTAPWTPAVFPDPHDFKHQGPEEYRIKDGLKTLLSFISFHKVSAKSLLPPPQRSDPPRFNFLPVVFFFPPRILRALGTSSFGISFKKPPTFPWP